MFKWKTYIVNNSRHLLHLAKLDFGTNLKEGFEFCFNIWLTIIMNASKLFRYYTCMYNVYSISTYSRFFLIKMSQICEQDEILFLFQSNRILSLFVVRQLDRFIGSFLWFIFVSMGNVDNFIQNNSHKWRIFMRIRINVRFVNFAFIYGLSVSGALNAISADEQWSFMRYCSIFCYFFSTFI